MPRSTPSVRERLPPTRTGITKKLHMRYLEKGETQADDRVCDLKVYINTGEYADGTLAEVFIKADKKGTTIAGLLSTASIAISMALQYGCPLDVLCDKLIGQRFEPFGTTTDPNMPLVASITDMTFRWLWSKYGTEIAQ